MQQAVNPQTGEVLFLVNNQWVPPAQIAQNEAGQKAYLVGNQWVMGAAVAPKPEEPEVAPTPAPAAAEAPQAAPAPTTETPPTAEQAPTAETPAETPAEQPGVLSRIGSFFTEPLPISERDKVIAGSIKKGIQQLGQVPAEIRYAELSGLQSSREKEYGENLENAPPEVKARHAETAKTLARLREEAALAGIERKKIEKEYGTNPLAKKLEDISQSQEYKDADFLGKSKLYGAALIDNASDIPGYIGTLGLESLPTSMAVMASAVATRYATGGSKTLAATAAGGTSAFMEFGGNYADLRAQGMGHEEAWEKAAVKSGVIGLFDGASFGAAGKAADVVMKNFEKGALRAAGKEALVGSTKQGAMGAAGELLGSKTIGEEADPIKMGAEFAGEFFTAPVEAASAYRGGARPTPTIPAEPEMITSTAPGISVSYPSTPQPAVPVQAATGETIPIMPLDAAQQQEAAVAAGRVEPTISAEPQVNTEKVVARRAAELRDEYNYPQDVAETVARGELARGELDVRRPEDIGAVAGVNEPSLSLPSERGGAPEGVTAPSVEGLADNLGGVREPYVGAGVERPALGETPILTERPVEAVAVEPAVIEAFDHDAFQKEAAKFKRRVADAQRVVRRAESGPETKAAKEKLAKITQEEDAFYEKNAPALKASVERTLAASEQRAETTPAEPAAPTLSREDQERLDLARYEVTRAQDELRYLASEGYTTPEQHYGVESAQLRLAQNQGVINELAPETAPAAETPAAAPEAPKKKRGRPPKAAVTTEAAEAAPTEPAKRGRKKLELTAEQAAAKAQTRKETQAETIKAAREVDKNIATLEKEFDPSEFESLDIARAVKADVDTDKKEAMYSLYKTSVDGRLKNTKAGQKAAAFLASDAVTPLERANLKARYDFEKKRGGALKAENTNGEANPAYTKFTNVKQAINLIKRTGTAFEKALARRLEPFLKDVRLIIANSDADVPALRTADGKTIRESFQDASGMYAEAVGEDGKRFKYLILRGEGFGDASLQGINNTIFLHEAIHAATNAKIDEYFRLLEAGKAIPADLQQLMNSLYDVMNSAQDRYLEAKLLGEPISPTLDYLFKSEERGGLDILSDPKEFVAYGMSNDDVQQFLMTAEGKDVAQKPGAIRSLFTRFVNALRAALGMKESEQSAMQDLILVSEAILQAQEAAPVTADEKASAAKQVKVDKNIEKVRLSESEKEVVDAVESLAGLRSMGNMDLLKARFDAMGSGFISKLLYTMQTADIIRWKGDEVPVLKELDRMVQSMSALRTNMMQAFAKKADTLAKFVRKNGQKELGRAMHLARLENVTPSLFDNRANALANDKKLKSLEARLSDPLIDPATATALKGEVTKRTKSINKVFDAWEALGKQKGGHEAYRMVRQFYKDANNLTRSLLDERIERLGLEGDVNDPNTPKGKIMAAVRRMHEEGDFAKIEEYFPFLRRGSYWLRVDGPTGREFYLFETGTARNAFEIKRARELGKDVEELRKDRVIDSGDDITALRKNYSKESQMLSDMFDAIDSATAKPGFDEAAKDKLKDELYQTYLMTLPEQSYRKQFLHAENVTGFSADVFRNFTESAMKIANQASRLKYADQIESAIDSGREALAGNPEKKKLELFINEVGDRARTELMPQEDHWIVNNINKFAYYWLLTGVASAAVQMVSVPVMVMPTLNHDYGYGKAAAKFAKYSSIWKSIGVTKELANGNVEYVAPSIGASSMVRNSPILQKAFQAFIERGLTTDTNVSVLTNRNRTPANAYDSIPGVAMRTTANMMSAAFNGAERLSREVTAMMTFELEYAKSGDFDAAVQKAVDTTQELLGRYDAGNRPKILRNAIGRTVGQFKQYAVNMTSYFVRNVYNMHKIVRPGKTAEGFEALHKLSGVLLAGALFHGVAGMPLYSVITSTIDALMDSLGDDEEKRRRRARNPFTADSSNLRFRYEYLPKMFGDIEITGLDGRPHRLNELIERGPISALTDMNIGSRTSFNDMWWREPKPSKNGQEFVANLLIANLGPGVSAGMNIVGGYDEFQKNHIGRGMEKILPAFFKNPVVAARVAEEGVKTPAGLTILKKEELSTANIIAQATGLQSTRVARLQDEAFEMNKEVRKAELERQSLTTKMTETLLSPSADAKDKREIMQEINKFNRRYPVEGLIMDADTILKSLENAAEKRGMAFRGQTIKENYLPYLLPPRRTVMPKQ